MDAPPEPTPAVLTTSLSREDSQSAKERVATWAAQSDSLTILVFGNLGCGKSSLINTLFGKIVAREGDGVTAVTKKTEHYREEKEEIKLLHTTVTINNIQITLWDTPGLRDPLAKEEIVKDIKKNCLGRVDLFLYCTDVRQTRIRQDDFSAIKELTDALGADIWQNTIFALNFANEVRLPPSSEQSLEDYFRDRVFQWKKLLRRAVMEAGVPESEVVKIPIVPTSYRDVPLPTGHGKEWFREFWSACVRQVKFHSLPAILKVKIPTAVYIGERLAGLGDVIEEKMLAEEKYLESTDLGGIPSGQFLQYLSEAIVPMRARDPWINPFSMGTAAIGCALIGVILWSRT